MSAPVPDADRAYNTAMEAAQSALLDQILAAEHVAGRERFEAAEGYWRRRNAALDQYEVARERARAAYRAATGHEPVAEAYP